MRDGVIPPLTKTEVDTARVLAGLPPLYSFRDWLKCETCGRLFHPAAKTCGNYCEEAR